jgi:ribosomal-protein-alanine N-acetyltransferase
VIHTPRLALAPATPHDHRELLALVTQPGVRRFLFDDQIWTSDQVSELLAKNEALFAEREYGLWLARPLGTRTLVGFGGFWFFHDPPDLQLIYAVADDHVSRGYGREIATAVVDYGFSNLQMPSIRACTDVPNVRSQRLLDALGFAVEKREMVGSLDTLFYTRGSGLNSP